MSRAGRDDDSGIHAVCVFRDLLDELVGEDVLRDGDGDGATEAVKEDGDGVARGHVLCAKHDLDGDEGDLDTGAGAEAGDDLVADPAAGVGAHAKRGEHAAADGEDGGAKIEERGVEAQLRDQAAYQDGGEGDADEVGDGADAGFFRRGAFHGLEIEGEVVNVRVEAHGEKTGEPGADNYGPLFCQKTWRDRGAFAEVDL